MNQKQRQKPIEILILGGGTAGWMAANIMAHKWSREQVTITLVESPDVDIIGVGEGSTPALKRFFQMLDVAESEWMPRCNATYKLNIRFEDWSPKSGIKSYSHPFTSQVDVFTSRPFMVNTRTRRLGLATHTAPEDFLINGVLAKKGMGPQTPDSFPFLMEYGYHFDAHLLGNYLSELAQSRGVSYRQAHVADVVNSDDGGIESLLTRDGEVLSANLFVDCTGFASVLMQKNQGVEFKPYAENLFNDSAVVLATPMSEKIPVETVSTALSTGWCWKIPLTNRFGNGYVFSSQFISPDKAETELRTHLNMLASDEQARHLKMRVGQIAKHWSRNCIGLGLSQGFIEPLEATALHLVQISVELFVMNFEKGGFSGKHRDDYNREIGFRFERVRDYIVAHYKLNTRDDSDYWRANRDNSNLSQPLIHILNTWYKREDLAAEMSRQNQHSHFDAVSWHCLLAGYGAYPELEKGQAFDGRGDLYLEQQVEQFLSGCSLNFKSHNENLSRLSNSH